MRTPFPSVDELRSAPPSPEPRPQPLARVAAEADTGQPSHAPPLATQNRPARAAGKEALGDDCDTPPRRGGRGGGGNGKSPFPEYIERADDAPDLDALRAEAEALRLKAIQDAERIREQAQREGYQRGYEQGYADGEQHARQLAETELQRTVASLRTQVEQIIQSLQAQYEAYLQNAEAQMLELALEVARKIVREELKLHPEHALAIVRDALRRVQGLVRLRIRVHPLDLELLRQNRAALMSVVDGVDGIEIVEDRRVDPGGCVIETEQGVYDARIKTQLSELERVIREAA
ncbi:MAG: FliH/SctL family protein, partial [Fimbriimonadales bacterium]